MSNRGASAGVRLRAVGVGAGVAWSTWRALAAVTGPEWRRHNYRDRDVNLAGGPALVLGAVAGAASAGADLRLPVLTAGVGAVGLADDLWGQTHARGLLGHARALARGNVTTGVVKLLVSTGLALALAPAGGRSSAAGRVRDAAVIAGSANLVNLLDLRPGRALKVVAGVGGGLLPGADGDVAAGVLGAAGAIAIPDLGEEAMIGDCGANAVGAALGWLVVDSLGERGRWVAAALVTAANLASERVSFTAVIERQPLLRRLDRLGRRD